MISSTSFKYSKLFIFSFFGVLGFVLVGCGSSPLQDGNDSIIFNGETRQKSNNLPQLSAEELRKQEAIRKRKEQQQRIIQEKKQQVQHLLTGSWRMVRPNVLQRAKPEFVYCSAIFSELKQRFEYQLFSSEKIEPHDYQSWLKRYDLLSAVGGRNTNARQYRLDHRGADLDILQARLDVQDWLAELLPGGSSGQTRFTGFIAFDEKTKRAIGGAGRFSAMPNEKLDLHLVKFQEHLYVMRLLKTRDKTELEITPLLRTVQKQKKSCRWLKLPNNKSTDSAVDK